MVQVSGDTDISSNSKILPEIGAGLAIFPQKTFYRLIAYRTQGDDVEWSYNEDDNLPSIFTVVFGLSYYFS